ncbi:MAG: hypothetical protein ACLUCE_04500 [Streptococcus sp.]|uniref:hypothetical protein n=1 Tax=Streptococcus sp. TaxID=1306 RepID=UPI00399375EE
MLEIIDARKKQGIPQKKLEELSGGQTTCYRTYVDGENGTSVRVMVLKILASLKRH